MKSPTISLSLNAFRPSRIQYAANFTSFVQKQGHALTKGAASFLEVLRIGRMESALNSMTNDQLKAIGIARTDIKAHAKHLITHTYDGL